jgi:hypothetical protein
MLHCRFSQVSAITCNSIPGFPNSQKTSYGVIPQIGTKGFTMGQFSTNKCEGDRSVIHYFTGVVCREQGSAFKNIKKQSTLTIYNNEKSQVEVTAFRNPGCIGESQIVQVLKLGECVAIAPGLFFKVSK